MPEPEMTYDEHDALEALAAEFMERYRCGEQPSVAEYAVQHPELADEIRDLFPTIATMERLKVQKAKASSGRASLGGVHLERLGDFRIIREIGRGGMGIVFEAEQESLGRHVAVKVLPKQTLLDAKHLQRFRREATTAAGLHHTNIVPVFGVGQQDGFHYYVMQYIHGVGLDRILTRMEHRDRAEPSEDLTSVALRLLAEPESRSTGMPHIGTSPALDRPTPTASAFRTTQPIGSPGPTEVGPSPAAAPAAPPQPTPASVVVRSGNYWASVAQLGVQVADALHYAHAKGTLHRDIKPANLILDAQGVVWVADFGLAKVLEQEPVSRTGEVVGTLSYLAPEQLRGQTDHRSDLYALGLTLYELLTWRPAFHDSDRTRLLQRIATEDPPRPRQLRPEIPQDLETIVLKASAREPERRYQSAGELAADLQCFLDDRPIQARRVTVVERGWRWCRRNRAVASLSALAVTLLFLVALVTSIGYARTRTALAGERTQRQRAETATDLAAKVLDRLYERFAPQEGESATATTGQVDDAEQSAAPILSEGTAAVLEDMLAFYDRLAEQGGSDSGYREKVALANRRVGDIRQHLGQFEPAAAAYQRALDIYQQLDRSVAHPSLVPEIAKVSNQLGSVYRQARQFQLGRESHQRALQLLQQALETSPSSPSLNYELAHTWYLLARCERADRPLRGPPGFDGPPAGPHYEGFYEDSGPHPPQGKPNFQQGRPGDSPGPLGPHPRRPPGKQPVDDDEPPWGPPEHRPPPRKKPAGDDEPPWGPPEDRPPLGMPLARIDATESAERGPEDPAAPLYRQVSDGPDKNLQNAIGVLTRLDSAAAPPEHQLLLVRCYRELAVGSLPVNAYRAVEAAVRADRILQLLVATHPDNSKYERELQRIHGFLTVRMPWLSEHEYGRIGQALEDALVAPSPAEDTRHPPFDQIATRAHLQHLLGILQQRLGQSAAAEKNLREAVSRQSDLGQRQPPDATQSFWLARFQFTLAVQLVERGRWQEARELLEASGKEFEQRLTVDAKLAFVHANLYAVYATLADALSATGEYQAAIDADRHAADHRQYLPQGAPPAPTDRLHAPPPRPGQKPKPQPDD